MGFTQLRKCWKRNWPDFPFFRSIFEGHASYALCILCMDHYGVEQITARTLPVLTRIVSRP